MKSLALRTDLLVMNGLTNLTEHADYWVQETPSEPDYWMGNQLIVKHADLDVQSLEDAFVAHFPSAKHRAIVWDLPDSDADTIAPVFENAGYERDVCDALTLRGEIADVVRPEGITLRMLESGSDWEQALQLSLQIGIEDGHAPERHAGYLRGRFDARRQQIGRDLGQWFGAFDNDTLVGQMGIFHDRDIARFQSVETAPGYRRRGICSALLRHSHGWVQERAPNATFVIVAETDGAPGRLYRRMGFAHTETITGVLRKAY